MRPTAARYVPPSRRGTTGNDADSAERRDLDGASSTAVSQVRLVALREGSIDISACPLDIEAQAGSESASWTVFFPDRQPQELLGWFAEAFGGGAGRLEFPPSLSKRQRAWWHGLADRSRGLHAVSVGVGDERHLTITAPPPGGSGGDAAADPAAGGQATSLTREQRQRAGQIYDCCQMEGGKFWERSRGEIEALVASQQPLPADLAELVHKRLRGQQVSELLRGGKPTEALALLSEDPRLAWVKDSQSGGYPAHIAAHKGYESVMYFLSSLPGVLEQRDGRRDTPLAVARRQRQSAVEEILLAAGAKPEVASKLESSSRPVTPAASTAAAAALDSSSGPEGQHCEYCSWSPEERHRYRHAGAGGGAPPGLQARGGSAAAQGSGSSADSRHKKAQGDQSRCPW